MRENLLEEDGKCLVKANWHNPKYRTIEHKQARLAGRESGNVLCVYLCGLAAKIN